MSKISPFPTPTSYQAIGLRGASPSTSRIAGYLSPSLSDPLPLSNMDHGPLSNVDHNFFPSKDPIFIHPPKDPSNPSHPIPSSLSHPHPLLVPSFTSAVMAPLNLDLQRIALDLTGRTQGVGSPTHTHLLPNGLNNGLSSNPSLDRYTIPPHYTLYTIYTTHYTLQACVW